MKDLPLAARVYVCAVLVAGATVLVYFGARATVPNLPLFAALLLF